MKRFQWLTALILGTILLGIISFCPSGFARTEGVLDLPRMLEEIEDEAFMNDEAIETVTIPGSVSRIGSKAFSGCSALWRVDIPESVRYIAPDAFDNCNVSFRTGNAYAVAYAAEQGIPIWEENVEKSGELNAQIQYSLRNGILEISGEGRIDSSLFQPWNYYREDITEIVFREGITAVRNGMFNGLNHLTSISFPASLKAIGDNAFYSIPDSISVYGTVGSAAQQFAEARGYAFHSCVTIMEDTPSKISLFDEETVTLEVVAEGDGLHYNWQVTTPGDTWGDQWYDYLAYLSDEIRNKPVLSKAFSNDSEGWQFRCEISDAYGNTAYSNVTELHFKEAAEITTEPVRTRCRVGDEAEFSLRAKGDGLHYSWKTAKNVTGPWTETGEDSPVLKTPVTEENIHDYYVCDITDQYGNSDHSAIVWVIECMDLTDPESITVSEGETATFRIASTGSSLRYQWQKLDVDAEQWTNIPGATNTVYSFTARAIQHGVQFRCAVKDEGGFVQYSAPALLSVRKGVTGVSLNVSTWNKGLRSSGGFLLATVEPADADNPNIIWTVSEPDYVSLRLMDMDPWHRIVYPKTLDQEGTVTVTATTEDGGYSASCVFTIRSGLNVRFIPGTESKINYGEMLRCKIEIEDAIMPLTAQYKLYQVGVQGDTVISTGDFSSRSLIIDQTFSGGGVYYYEVSVTDALGYTAFARSEPIKVIRHAEDISLNKNTLYVSPGATKQLQATISPEDTTEKEIFWYSLDPDIATVDEEGSVSGQREGTTIVFAQCAENEAVLAMCEVHVQYIAESISFPEPSITLVRGEKRKLQPVFSPEEASRQGIKSCSGYDQDVISITNGEITAIAPGTTRLWVWTWAEGFPEDGVYTVCNVTVIVPVEGITLDRSDVSLYTAFGVQLNAMVEPADYTEKLIWTSSNEDIVWVNSSGEVLGRLPGTAVVTVSTMDGRYSASCSVTVTAWARITIQEEETRLREYSQGTFHINWNRGIPPYTVTLDIYQDSERPRADREVEQHLYASYTIAENTMDKHADFRWTAGKAGSYYAIARITDAFGMTGNNISGDITAYGRVNIEEVSVESFGERLMYTGLEPKCRIVVSDGKPPYTLKVSVAYANNRSNISQTEVIKNTTDCIHTYRPYFGTAGDYVIHAEVVDANGDTAVMDSEPFTIHNVLVSMIETSVYMCSLKVGETMSLTTRVYPEDATNPRLNCYIDGSRYLSVLPDGTLEGRQPGKAVIYFEAEDGGGATAEVHITVWDDEKPVNVIYIGPDDDDEETVSLKRTYEEEAAERREMNDSEYEYMNSGSGDKPDPYRNPVSNLRVNIVREDLMIGQEVWPDVSDILGMLGAHNGTVIYCYLWNDMRYNVYCDKYMTKQGTVEDGERVAYIDPGDEIILMDMGTNKYANWAYVEYTGARGKRYHGYIELFAILAGKANGSTCTERTFTLYNSLHGGKGSYTVQKGEALWKIATVDHYVQVLMQRTDGSYNLGWCTEKAYNNEWSAGELLSFDELRSRFPDGKFWCHHEALGEPNSPYTVSDQKCSCDKYHGLSRPGTGGHTYLNGYCGCNSFNEAIQCHGFGNLLGHELFGSDYVIKNGVPASDWTKYEKNNLPEEPKPGDLIRVMNDGHTAMITECTEGKIRVVDCNYTDPKCNITWDREFTITDWRNGKIGGWEITYLCRHRSME